METKIVNDSYEWDEHQRRWAPTYAIINLETRKRVEQGLRYSMACKRQRELMAGESSE